MVTLRRPPESSTQSTPFAPAPGNPDRSQEWSTALQTVLDQPAASLPWKLALAGLLFGSAFSAWAWWGQVDEVTQAQGKLIPQNEVYKVVPIDTGRVARVAVKEGDVVRQGQVLVELDTELADKEVERLETLIQSTESEMGQNQALIEQMRLQGQTRIAIAEAQIHAHDASLEEYQQTITTQHSLIQQLEDDKTAQQERFDRLKLLSDEGALPREKLFEAEQQMRDRHRSITENQGVIERTQAQIQRLKVEREHKEVAVQQAEVETEQAIEQIKLQLSALRTKLRESQVMLDAAKTRRKQQFIYAPVNGILLTLHKRHDGSVVQPGEAIAEIAPEGKPLVLTAVVPSQNSGFIKPEMEAKIKFDAYPYQDYGIISGKVQKISLDSQSTDQMGQVYKVEIALDRNFIRDRNQQVLLKPGQTGMAEIVTRRRRIADVILDPLKKMQGNVSL
jgi:hemolysin D